MWILRVQHGDPNRLIHDVQFRDGEAKLPDHLKAKADYISKFWNVDVEYVEGNKDPEDVDYDRYRYKDAETERKLADAMQLDNRRRADLLLKEQREEDERINAENKDRTWAENDERTSVVNDERVETEYDRIATENNEQIVTANNERSVPLGPDEDE